MNKKLTIKFFKIIMGIIGVTIGSCVIVNLIISGIMLQRNPYKVNKFYSSVFDIEEYSEEFKGYIDYEDGEFTIPFKLESFFKKNKIWLQILDAYNNEVYSSNRPKSLPTGYDTYELLNYVTNPGTLSYSTLYTNSIIVSGRTYTCIIGYPVREYSVVSFGLSEGNKARIMHTLLFAIFCIAVGAYYCSKLITKPFNKIVENIKDLASGRYVSAKNEMEPFYDEVNNAMDRLSENLAKNVVENQQLEDKRGEWIANISHDLKAPLASIKGYSQLLTTGEYELMLDEIQKYGKVIEKNAIYMEDLISDLSFIYKIRNRAVLMDIQTYNVIAIIQDIIINILNNPKYENRQIEFEYLQEQVFLKCDKKLITRAITNLLYNAIVHNTEQTKISVKVLKKASTVQIILSDDGKGIAKEDIDALFKRYYRASNVSKKNGGSGLGMAISKEIIEGQDGKIELESTLGKGTTVLIEFKN